ncbi:MAG: hypothetical protein U9Q69_03130 [Nanoarchaeota archaeon]|nr:hypothetical protein [Nanoarchaeota archaeon]
MSFEGEELFKVSFSKSIIVNDIEIPITENYLNLFFPYSRKAKEIIIFEKESQNEVLRIDLAELLFCNFDGICDIDENEETCPEDCYIKEPIREIIESKEPDKTIEKKVNYTNIILIIVIFLAILIALLLFLKRKEVVTDISNL